MSCVQASQLAGLEAFPWARFAGAVALLTTMSLSCPVLAQEAQEHSPFERSLQEYRATFEYGGFQPNLSTILPGGTNGRWTASAGVEGMVSDNYEQDSQRRDASSLDGFAGVGWLKNTPRLQGSLDYQYRTDLYRSNLLKGEDRSAHRVSGVFGWQAGRHWSLSGGAHYAEQVESGLLGTPDGIRATFNNRYNEYSADLSSDARFNRAWSNRSSYTYAERDYDSGSADGEDVATHVAGTRFDWRVGRRDTLSPAYEYNLEDNETTRIQRRNHRPSVTWTHELPGRLGARSATVDVSYLGDRALEEAGSDSWNHAVDLGYRTALSPRTGGRVWGGYQWIRSDDGANERNWRYGLDGEHRFSERTVLTLAASELWDYTAASATSDATTLTRVTRGSAALASQVTRRFHWNLQLQQEQGDVAAGGADGDYWQTGGVVGATYDVAQTGFLGAEYRPTRRSQDRSEEDYWLHRASLFSRWEAAEWLSLGLRYAYEYRDYDSQSRLESYRENRVTGNLTVRL